MNKHVATLLALVLALCMLAAPASANMNWYESTARAMAGRMAVLVDNQTYLAFFMDVRQDGVEEELAMMTAAAHAEVQQVMVLRYAPEKLDEYIGNYFMEDRVDEEMLLVQQELLRRMNPALPGMLNGTVGGTLWLALSESLRVRETFAMPEDFEECALVLDYGLDTCVMVTFTLTGVDTVTAEGYYIRTDAVNGSYEDAEAYINLLWERQ